MPTGNLAGFVALGSAGSLFDCLINLVPMSNSRSRTDGLVLIDALSMRGLRKIRFAASYMDAKDEINRLVQANEPSRAKELVETLLSLATDIPDSSELVKALRAVMEWISQADTVPKQP